MPSSSKSAAWFPRTTFILDTQRSLRHSVKANNVWKVEEYNVPMKLDKISEILSEPDIIKDRKLSGKKVRENGEKKTIYS